VALVLLILTPTMEVLLLRTGVRAFSLAAGYAAMNEPTIQFPVTCPVCGTEALGEYSVADVADALISRSGPLQLRASCHNHRWTASKLELQQIREYLGAWLKALRTDFREGK
jgi:hypothetical protein